MGTNIGYNCQVLGLEHENVDRRDDGDRHVSEVETDNGYKRRGPTMCQTTAANNVHKHRVA